MHIYDAVIVGAGPAGAAAAVTAADRGLDVVVVDKASFPRDKACGDGLTTAALRILDRLGLETNKLESYTPVETCVIVGPSGRHVALPVDNGRHLGAVVPRRELDASLVALARERGATVREGVAVHNLAADHDAVLLHTNAASLHARFVIAADGQYSVIRRLVAPAATPRLGEWQAFRQYFNGVADPRLWVIFDADLLPGYAWVFPLPDGRANVGFGVLRNAELDGHRLKALWRDLPSRPSLRAALGNNAQPEATAKAWPIPTRFDPGALTSGRVLFAGDAAPVVDPMTGEGIPQALETGILAASAVAQGGTVADVATRYRRAVVRTLRADTRLALALQRFLRSPQATELALRAVDSSAWTRRHFARWMWEAYPRALLFTPSRWRRGARSR